MKLLTAQLRKQLPKLYSTEEIKLEDKIVYAKYFTPWGSYTAWLMEGEEEGDDFIFFGFATGVPYPEFGTFSLKEFESVRGFGGLGIERDLSFTKRKVSEIPEIMEHIL